MKKFRNVKLILVITISLFLVAIVVVLQKPFRPQAFDSRSSEWTSVSLNTIQDRLEAKEKAFPNLKKECEKKINFFGAKTKTDFSFIYMPGFSATRKEIFPVVESLSKQFSANSFLTRFPAHGESATDFKNYSAQGFFDTLYEAVEIGAKLGKRKIFVGTSTGSALISAGLVQKLDIDAAILIAPAYSVYPENAWLLSTRLGAFLKILLLDEIRTWIPKNPAMENYWNTSYHRDGVSALLQAVEYIRSLDFSGIQVPVLMLYTQNDNVVLNSAIHEKFNQIKEPRKRLVEIPSSQHVLAGEFTSPETTELVIKDIHDWLQLLNW